MEKICKWTDRFVKLPIEVYNKEHKELTGKEDCVESYIMINPFSITEYRPTFLSGEEHRGMIYTCICSRNGEETTILLHIDEFEELINKNYGQ